jgi:hypothetical protein
VRLVLDHAVLARHRAGQVSRMQDEDPQCRSGPRRIRLR